MQKNQDQEPAEKRDMYILKDFSFSDLSTIFILKHSGAPIDTAVKGYYDLVPQHISLEIALFTDTNSQIKFPQVEVQLVGNTLMLTCACISQKNRLCEHQSRTLFNLMDRNELRIFFDQKLRHHKIRLFAAAYGLENESNPDDFFTVQYANKKAEIIPVIKDLLPVTTEKNKELKELLIPKNEVLLPIHADEDFNTKKILILKHHRYYSHFQTELLECATSINGKIKNPLKQLNAMDFIWATENTGELKFYTAVSRFQNNYENEKSTSDLEGLKALVKNPLELDVFYHDAKISQNISVNSLVPITLKNRKIEIVLSVDLKDGFYTITGELILAGKSHDIKMLNLRFQHFIYHDHIMYLIDNSDLLKIIDFLRQNSNHLIIHESKFIQFQEDILANLENKIRINYSYVKPATNKQLKESSFDHSTEKIIYLSYSENYVLINPVMRYGNIEIPVQSRKQIYAADKSGNMFMVTRNEEEELKLITAITRCHPTFEEQLESTSFYLHKKRFLEDDWFLNAFEAWGKTDISIMGFNELKDNNLNPNKVKISIAVNSGLNWFDSEFDISFGKQKVSLQQLHRSIRNKSKFIKLGDGTMGILPQDWINKLTKYFNAGEVTVDSIRIPKVNFSSIIDLYEEELLSAQVKMELCAYKAKIKSFKNIEHIAIPPALNATLRDYQKEGLNWLNFLDEF